ncbi:hypothetical protein PVAND_001415 [Polypedilum vanderplanki]|uniref:carboxylesterase n=1 Tax=Polypedilum vanderplanki TaxID=319348 RepID=A0A9J6BP66_POLVA|nr:hypothetical protein PVAND_001415 [Polypedilum vanderplanki]
MSEEFVITETKFEKAAEEPDIWNDMKDALEEPQLSAGKNSYINKFVGSDDCLYLNVYTKCINPKKLMATIVYIYGGGFFKGSSILHSYSPDYILMHDVVMVIFNYRLGQHGFLKLSDKSINVPGNAEIKDLQLAMKFVRENIKNFGGDPTQNHYRIRQLGPDVRGVLHGDELCYIWKNGQGGVPSKKNFTL